MKPTTRVCKNCGGTRFDRDITTTASDLTCFSCGAVQEENPIVSEVSFGESSSGAAVVQGSFIGADQAHGGFQSLYGGKAAGYESREQTLGNAKRRIRSVALALKIPEYISDAAFQWFQLALTNNFVKGRRSQNVVASCLYIACRKEKTHHMLIDFSSRLQVSVFSIGATYMKMVKALHITNLPLADPSIFIQHFSENLDFGKKRVKVVRDAVRLASKMSEDWIREGRRSAGVAGACLLLAARMNNFRRTKAEIVNVSHVCEETIQKRLKEFSETSSASLTVQGFRDSAEEEENKGQGEITKRKIADPPSFTRNRKKDEKESKKIKPTLDTLKSDPLVKQILDDGQLTSDEITKSLERVMNRKKEPEKKTEIQTWTREGKNLPSTEEMLSKVRDDPDSFSDIEDEELDSFLLEDDEVERKKFYWYNNNREYLLEEERKKLLIESQQKAGTYKPPKKRKKVAKKEEDDDISRASTPAEGMKNMLQKRPFSKKINYDVVDNILNKQMNTSI